MTPETIGLITAAALPLLVSIACCGAVWGSIASAVLYGVLFKAVTMVAMDGQGIGNAALLAAITLAIWGAALWFGYQSRKDLP